MDEPSEDVNFAPNREQVESEDNVAPGPSLEEVLVRIISVNLRE